MKRLNQGGRGNPSETENFVVENGVISDGSIVSNKFPKISKNSILYEFSSNIFKMN